MVYVCSMGNDLTTSAVARQNILNNPLAVKEMEKSLGIKGMPFEGSFVVFKEQVAEFFGVTTRTVESQCAAHSEELAKGGYAVLCGKRLKSLKESVPADFDPEGNIGITAKTNRLARLLRQTMLDIAIDTVNMRTGGTTKFINQHDEEYLEAAFAGETYRKEFTDALRDHLDMGNFKYAVYTDRIYQAIFLKKIEGLSGCAEARRQ